MLWNFSSISFGLRSVWPYWPLGDLTCANAVLLFVQFHNWRDTLLVLGILPFCATGGIWSLLLWGTPFSISAADGFTSLIGVATLGAVVFLAGVRRAQRESGMAQGLQEGSVDEMRPVLMACMAECWDRCQRRYPVASARRRSSHWRAWWSGE